MVLIALQRRNKGASTGIDRVALVVSVPQKVHAGLGRRAVSVGDAGRESVARQRRVAVGVNPVGINIAEAVICAASSAPAAWNDVVIALCSTSSCRWRRRWGRSRSCGRNDYWAGPANFCTRQIVSNCGFFFLKPSKARKACECFFLMCREIHLRVTVLVVVEVVRVVVERVAVTRTVLVRPAAPTVLVCVKV